ncbi:MAG TPA: polyhydroxyalkanoate depolymerase, partial [Cupriavidus sp.]|nr:polyhydroxyalkanoate depolymerase [Cupriavidus sp.]
MLYQTYQLYADMMQPACSLADIASTLISGYRRADNSETLRALRAWCEVLALARLTHYRPPFGIDRVRINGRGEYVPVTEEIVIRTPFCTLLRFRREGAPQQPRVLLVAPMSGHFATLLRGTVETMLRDHDVYIT